MMRGGKKRQGWCVTSWATPMAPSSVGPIGAAFQAHFPWMMSTAMVMKAISRIVSIEQFITVVAMKVRVSGVVRYISQLMATTLGELVTELLHPCQ